jgi:hypothetical protein
MWLDLAEMRLILEALEHLLEQPPGAIDVERVEARRKLRDYFREQVARVQKVSDEWERRKAHGEDEA